MQPILVHDNLMLKLSRNFTVRRISLFIFGLILINFILNNDFPTRQYYEDSQQSIWTQEMKFFCSKVQQRIEDENNKEQSSLLFQTNIEITPSNFNDYNKQQS